eukprot:scaffold45910_cov65-Phaeocystis_antarctica.AAC.2
MHSIWVELSFEGGNTSDSLRCVFEDIGAHRFSFPKAVWFSFPMVYPPIEYQWNAEVSYGSAAAIPKPRSNAPRNAFRCPCPPAGCSLRTWQVPGLGRAPAPLNWRLRRCDGESDRLSNSSVLVACTCVGSLRSSNNVGFLSKSFRAATGVKDLEGKFEVFLQDPNSFSVSFLGAQKRPPPRATHITKACPAAMHPPPGRPHSCS